jgi:hypothetical protein
MSSFATDPAKFVATTDDSSAQELARELGYPETWHVVREVPHPADRSGTGGNNGGGDGAEVSDQENSEGEEDDEPPSPSKSDGVISFMDTIYTGKPKDGVDVYYNHSAALGAAVAWDPETSSGFDAHGGHNLPRQAKFSKGETVEVLDEEDESYHKADITKVKVYANDIRYTVHYPEEDATQVVSEELLRPYVKPPSKKRKKKDVKADEIEAPPSSKKGKKRKADDSAASSAVKKKKGRPKPSSGSPAAKRGRRPTFASYDDHVESLTEQEIHDRLDMARGFGLPEKWLAKRGAAFIYSIWSYPEFQRFGSKKAAYNHLGWDEEEIQRRVALVPEQEDSSPSKEEEKADMAEVQMEEEEDDPPFRRDGHDYIRRRVMYKHAPDEAGGMKITQTGTVTGWLDSTDVDSKGDSAFLSEVSGKPATLFHVDFDAIGPTLEVKNKELYLEFVDLEEWELEKILLAVQEEAKASTPSDVKHGDEAEAKEKSTEVDKET